MWYDRRKAALFITSRLMIELRAYLSGESKGNYVVAALKPFLGGTKLDKKQASTMYGYALWVMRQNGFWTKGKPDPRKVFVLHGYFLLEALEELDDASVSNVLMAEFPSKPDGGKEALAQSEPNYVDIEPSPFCNFLYESFLAVRREWQEAIREYNECRSNHEMSPTEDDGVPAPLFIGSASGNSFMPTHPSMDPCADLLAAKNALGVEMNDLHALLDMNGCHFYSSGPAG